MVMTSQSKVPTGLHPYVRLQERIGDVTLDIRTDIASFKTQVIGMLDEMPSVIEDTLQRNGAAAAQVTPLNITQTMQEVSETPSFDY